MTRWLYSLFVLLLGVPALASPQAALAAAWQDAQRLPAGVREQTRYLSLHAIPPDQREQTRKVLAFHCNSLSREAELIAPRQVAPYLVAVTLTDYGWDAKTWEKLAEAEPYFHVSILVDEYQDWGYHSNGRWVTTRREKTGRKIRKASAAAPWLDTAQIAGLIAATQSQVPIVRADWFVNQTGISEGRKAGYYEFLGLQKRADIEKLAGLDIKAAQRLRKEIGAIVPQSGVALHNRQIYRYQTLGGPYWITLDTEDSTDKRNGIRLLNGDFADNHDAEEIYFTLPSGLPGYGASSAKGDLQRTVPDKIASDGSASGNDRRIHVGPKSCAVCHVEVIRPIDDWARKLYRGNIQLQAVDPAKFVRLRQLYLSDLDKHVKRDQDDYADAIKRVNGLTPLANAKAYAAFWDAYQEQPLRLTDAARELGTSEKRLTAAIERRVAAGLADPVLTGLIQKPPLTIIRQHWEELQPIVWQTLDYRP